MGSGLDGRKEKERKRKGMGENRSGRTTNSVLTRNRSTPRAVRANLAKRRLLFAKHKP